ncbi:MAG: endonuclease MutS2 [Sphingomonadales bacterium]
MIYPSEFDVIIGFDRIREALKQRCRFASSSVRISSMAMLTDVSVIREYFDQTDQWRLFTEKHPAAVPFDGSEDLMQGLAVLAVENTFFTEEELFALSKTLQNYLRTSSVLRKFSADYPLLHGLLGEEDGLLTVVRGIDAVLSEKGQLKPNASVPFAKLSTDIERIEKEVRSQVKQIFKQWRDAGYTADAELTVREERIVIPVRAEHKRRVNGFVKDVSSTGQVLFVEPVESLELNNRLKELYADRRRERERILLRTTDTIRPYHDSIKSVMQSLLEMDLVSARLAYAVAIGAQRPVLRSEATILLKKAINPLLKTAQVVPLEIQLSVENRFLVISGPNAGGKSVALKTAFLLQYMVQHGLFIPASPDSECGVFEGMMIDCGDGQSMDTGLSTFSAHLAHLKAMTDAAKPGILLGVDEIGDGTDPRFGGPIARVILDQLLKKGASAIVTTHFSSVKEWAGQTAGVQNAGMAYDLQHLQPLYRMVPGKPGSSFALQLLKKTGFSNQIIQEIEGLGGEESRKTEHLLIELEQQQAKLQQLLIENEQKEKHLQLLLEEYHSLKQKIEGRRREMLEQAKIKAGRMLDEANKHIEMTIRVIREHKADKVKTQEVRGKLNKFKEQIKTETAPEEKPVKPLVPVKWLPGMPVKSMQNGAVGEVLEVKKDKLKVALGLVQVWLPITEVAPAEKQTTGKRVPNAKGFNWIERSAAFNPRLDLRGEREEDALKKLAVWMDEAYALGQFNLKVVHGRGDGILRKSLRQYLKSVNYVRSYHSEQEEQGGDGCTIIALM